MKFQSISLKILSLISIIFLAIITVIVFVADREITRIIDNSQTVIYKDKLEVLYNKLSTVNDRLKKTGMVEVYEHGFKESILEEWKSLYYTNEHREIYPFVCDVDYKMIMHPTLSLGVEHLELSSALNASIYEVDESGEVGKLKPNSFGTFLFEFQGEEKWYVYQQYKPFGWIICYGIPLDIKYQERDSLRTILLVILASVMFIALIILSIFIRHIIKPIIKLTNISTQFALGNLDEVIDINTKDEVGRLAFSFSTMRDSIKNNIISLKNEIYDRMQAEERLKTAQDYIENIINSMPSIVVGVDENCNITHWNNMAVKQTSRDSNYAIGKPLLEVLTFIDPMIVKVRESIIKREVLIDKSTKLKINEKTHYCDITIYPIHSGEESGAVIRIDDVTDQFHMQAELGQSRRMEAVGQLVGGVAHDFNNMLAGIVSSVQLLQMQSIDWNPKSLELIDIINQASSRATELIAQLLLFSRKSDNMSTSISIHSLIDDVTLLLKRSLDKKINLNILKNANLETVLGDKSQIQNSIMNICINASHAMPNGGDIFITSTNVVLDEVFCNVSQFDITPGEYIEIELKDTGTGISADNIAKIFNPFFTTKEQGKGTGLGLSSVYGIVKNHNGAINVYSEMGIGTVFEIYLPLTAVEVEDDKDISVVKGEGLILVVDDEELIRMTIEGMLEALGYDVIMAKNGKEGVDKYIEHQESIDMVIVDMIMPVMNGREAFEEIRKVNNDCKVILSSGFSKTEDVLEMKKQGLIDFIKKPYRYEDLSQVLAKHLSK